MRFRRVYSLEGSSRRRLLSHGMLARNEPIEIQFLPNRRRTLTRQMATIPVDENIAPVSCTNTFPAKTLVKSDDGILV